MFLIFHDFQFSCHISRPTVDFSEYSTFSVFLAIFHVLKCVFLIFRDFQFSRHIPGPSVCISHFSRFLVISSFFKSSSGCFSFSMIFSFLAIFHVLQWTFLNFPPFSVFLAIFHVLKCVFLIFRDFQFSRHIPAPSGPFPGSWQSPYRRSPGSSPSSGSPPPLCPGPSPFWR